MKRIVLMAMALMMALPQISFAQKKNDLKVMSYNIRLGIGKDGTNSWQYRCPATLAMLEDQKPDVFGVQEAVDFQVKFLDEFADDYKSVVLAVRMERARASTCPSTGTRRQSRCLSGVHSGFQRLRRSRLRVGMQLASDLLHGLL